MGKRRAEDFRPEERAIARFPTKRQRIGEVARSARPNRLTSLAIFCSGDLWKSHTSFDHSSAMPQPRAAAKSYLWTCSLVVRGTSQSRNSYFISPPPGPFGSEGADGLASGGVDFDPPSSVFFLHPADKTRQHTIVVTSRRIEVIIISLHSSHLL